MRLARNVRMLALSAGVLAMAAGVRAQDQTTRLQGSYVLAEEGTTTRGKAVVLAQLEFASSGVVTGKQLDTNSMEWNALSGQYSFDGSGVGTLELYRTSQDTEGDLQTSVMRYRFAVSTSGLQAIRTDGSTLSVAELLEARSSLTGAFVFSDVDVAAARSRVVSLRLAPTGTVTGTAIQRQAVNVSVTGFGGNYVSTSTGIGTLSLVTDTLSDNGDTTSTTESYLALPTKSGAVLYRSQTQELIFLQQ